MDWAVVLLVMLLPPYFYLLSWAASKAYFEVKLRYHNTVLSTMQRENPKW